MQEPTPTEKHLEAYRNIAANLADAWFTMRMTDRAEMERMGTEILDSLFATVFRDLIRAELHQHVGLPDVAREAVRQWVERGDLKTAAVEQTAVAEEVAKVFGGADVRRLISKPITEVRAKVYRLQAQGLNWAEIGARLGISATRARDLYAVAANRVKLIRQELAMYEGAEEKQP